MDDIAKEAAKETVRILWPKFKKIIYWSIVVVVIVCASAWVFYEGYEATRHPLLSALFALGTAVLLGGAVKVMRSVFLAQKQRLSVQPKPETTDAGIDA